MKNLVDFKSTDFRLGEKLDKKIIDARVNIKFTTRNRVSLESYDIGIRDLPTDLRKAANKATDMVISELGAALDEAMMAAVWDWTNDQRDIVDTGKLMGSRSIQKSGNGFTVAYSAPYAGIVHYGGYIQPYGNPGIEKIYYPSRPWIDSVLNGGGPVPQFDFAEVFNRAFQEVADKYR